jgi:integrase
MQYAIYGRIQEPAALHVEDFDLANNRLKITKKVQWLKAKGYGSRVVSGAKANGGKIFSPIPTLALNVYNEWRLRSGIRSGLLFQIDGKLIEYRQIQYRYDLALKAAGLPFRSTHILRHAALSEAYAVCENLLAVRDLAGHKNLKATERYAKVRDEKIAKTQRQMDRRLATIQSK